MKTIGFYQVDNIYNCNCYEAIKDVANKSIDLVILDPPYKMASRGAGFHKKGDYYDVINQKDMTKGLDNLLLEELERVMKKQTFISFVIKTN